MDKKNKDYLLRFWLLLILVALGLVVLYFLPPQIGPWEMNKVDLLSDLRYEEPDTIAADATGAVRLSEGARKDNAKVRRREAIYERLKNEAEGGTSSASSVDSATIESNTIIDMTAEHDGLRGFFAQLRRRGSLGRPVRIAILGDSFIEGDIFSGSLRAKLQALA